MIPAEARGLVRRLWMESSLPREHLRASVAAHLRRCRAEHAQNELVDLDQAEDLAQRCLRLLDALPDDASSELLRLVQVAVRYLVIEEDGESDMDLGGLDDDECVVEVVEEALRDAGLLRL